MFTRTSLAVATLLVLPVSAIAGCTPKPDAPVAEREVVEEQTMSESVVTPDITVTEEELEESTSVEQAEEDFPYPWTMGPVEATTEGDTANPPMIVNVRTASHDGYDRLVIDFKGGSLRGWDVAWVQRAVEQGRGEDLAIEGPALLDIRAKGASIPVTDTDYEQYFGDRSIPSAGGIRAVYDSTFEGTTHVVIGADSERPFRVFALSDPSRLVIDVQN